MASRFYNSNLPPILYHYTDLNGFMGIINDKCLWATDIYYLNDFSEMAYAFDFISERIKSFMETIPREDRHRLGLRTHSDDEIRTEYEFFEDLGKVITGIKRSPEYYTSFVCSFSKNGDRLSQWRGYSPREGGYCIAFDRKKLVELSKGKFSICQCLYNPDKNQKKLVDEIITQEIHKNFEKSSKRCSDNGIIIEAMIEFYFIAPRLKDPAFHEEEEWRFFQQSTRPIKFNIGGIKYRPGSKVLIPYTEFELAEETKDLPIKGITVGPMPHQELAKRSLDNYLNSKNFKCDIKLSPIPYRIL